MYASRMSNLPPYLFARIDEMKAEQQKKGVDIIDLGVGDPDLPTPDHIVASLIEAAKNPENHHYPSYAGMPAYRAAVADWYKKRFGVRLDPGKEVVALMGSKDGIAHIAEAFVNPGDYVLAPSPGYPVYRTGTLFAEGIVHDMPLTRENTFVPVLDDIPKKVIRSAKLMFINYPNNPTAAVAPDGFYREVVDFASDNNIVVVSDNAYSEIAFDGYRAPSFLETKGADGGWYRDALTFKDLQHDWLADRYGSRQCRYTGRSRAGQDKCGLGCLQCSPAGCNNGTQRFAGMCTERLCYLPGAQGCTDCRAAGSWF